MLPGVITLRIFIGLKLEIPVMRFKLIIICLLTVHALTVALVAQLIEKPAGNNLPDNPNGKKDQKDEDDEDKDTATDLVLDTHPDTDSLLVGAYLQMKKNDHAGAFRRYEFGLTGAEGRMFRIQPNLYYGVSRHCRTQILKIPPERFGPEAIEKQGLARRMFRQARQDMDRQALEEISQLLFWTAIGADAMELLADIHMETDHTTEALPLYFRLLNEHQLTPENQIRITRKTAAALIEKSDVGALKLLLERLDPNTPISDGTQIITVAKVLEDIENKVVKLDSTGWHALMGNVKRTGFATTPPSADVPKWSYQIDPQRGKKPTPPKNTPASYRPMRINYPVETRLDKLFRHLNLHCPNYPLVSHGRVLFVEGNFITALDFKTGNFSWRVGHPFGATRINQPGRRNYPRGPVRRGLGWGTIKRNRKPGNTMAVNGNTLYAFRPDTNGYELEIIDIPTGKRLGGTSARDESTKDLPKIAGFGGMAYDKGYLYLSLMSTPPKREQGQVRRRPFFRTPGINYHYEQLACLDVRTPMTPRLVWRQSIYSRTGGKQKKNEALHPPTVGDGAVFYNSDEGVIAALESTTGDIRWVSTYRRQPTFSRLVPPKDFDSTQQSFNPIPLYADGIVYCMPGGTNRIIALDSKTGETLWTYPRDRVNYILGLRDGVLYLSGSRIEAVDIKTQKTLWAIDPGDMVPAGMGCLAGDLLLVPVRKFTKQGFEDVILRVDLVTEKLIDPIGLDSSNKEIGNLVVVDDKLLAINQKLLSVFETRRQYQTRLNKKLNKDPNDPQALYRLGTMKTRLKENGPAIEHLEKALKGATGKHLLKGKPLRKAIIDRLYQVYMTEAKRLAAEEDFSQSLKMSQKALKHAKTTDRKVTAALARAGAQEKLGKTTKAVAEYQKCLERYPDIVLTDSDFKSLSVSDFSYRQIQRLIDSHGKAAYRLVDERAAKLLAQGKPENLQTIVQNYPFTSVRPQALDKLAQGNKKAGNFNEAAAYLKQLALDYPNHLQATTSIKEAVDLYARAKNPYNGWQLLQTIGRNRPDEREFVETKSKLAIYKRAQIIPTYPLPWVKYPLVRQWQISPEMDQYDYGDPSRFININNRTLTIGTHLSSSMLKAFDVDTGRLVWEKPGYNSPLDLKDRTEAILARHENGIHRLDPLTGNILWKLSPKQIPGFEKFNYQIDPRRFLPTVKGNRIFMTYFGSRESKADRPVNELLLVAADLDTGRILWHHTQKGQNNYRSPTKNFYFFDKGCATLIAIPTEDNLQPMSPFGAVGSNRHKLQIISNETGKVVFEKEIPELKGNPCQMYQLDNQHLAFGIINKQPRPLILYNITERKLVWKTSITNNRSGSFSLQRAGDLILAISRNGINTIDINTGKQKGTLALKKQTVVEVLSDTNYAYFFTGSKFNRTGENIIHCLDSAKGQEKWTLKLPADFRVCNIRQTDRYLYSIWVKGHPGSNRGRVQLLATQAYLVCIDKRSGKLLYKTHLAEFAPVMENQLKRFAYLSFIDGHVGINLNGSFFLMKSQ